MEEKMHALALTLALAQAELAQARYDAALAQVPPVGPGPPVLGNIPIPALNAGGVTGPRVRPAVIPGLVVSASFTSIPDIIWKLVGTAGWVTHIPLTYFADEFIEDTDEHHKLEEAYHMTPNGKWVCTGGDKLPNRNEAGLQPTAWFRACRDS
ncbi:hypothetical protein FRC10_007085 [Ceratobasidium sp. 414]|nr:hypothetical protein FRC10_007085 [Ceratobasidium sp. 414]